MKTRQDNDVTSHTSAVYAEIEIELAWLVRHDEVYVKK